VLNSWMVRVTVAITCFGGASLAAPAIGQSKSNAIIRGKFFIMPIRFNCKTATAPP
jgi:hypothetical protein